MKKRTYPFLASIILLTLSLVGCVKETGEAVTGPDRPQSYLELLRLFDEGRNFLSAGHRSGSCVITFVEDNYTLTVDESDFRIHDCRTEAPKKVTTEEGFWKVGEELTDIRVDFSVSGLKSVPVYAYFDSQTLHLYTSNRRHLAFPFPKYKPDYIEKIQNIPVVRIKTDNNAPIVDKKNYVKGTITISDPECLYSDEAVFEARMGIRGRGNSTWGWEKKPWKVKLDEKASVLGMPADKEWAMLANHSDKTLIRNITAMKISEICGFSWTPRMVSVEVYLNDEYQGVYNFCEHKKVSEDRVNIDVVSGTDNSGDAVTGGYYFEIEQNMDETTCWETSMKVPMMFSDPEVPTAEQLEYVKKYFDDFEAALHSPDLADPETGYAKYVDVESFIHFYFIQELTKNVDGNFRKSSFLTKERGKKLEMYHVWDFDLTLGNSVSDLNRDPEGFFIKNYNSQWYLGENWFNLMLNDPAFVSRVKARWNELLPELEGVIEYIGFQAMSLEKAQQRNFEKWDINSHVDLSFPSLGSYEAEIEYLKDFYTKRLNWLTTEINKF